jgi:predicted Fe-Mo cluster-binding NifX family protein
MRRIEANVRKAVPHIERVLIHLEASASRYVRYAVPLTDREGKVSEHFGEAPFFAFVKVRRGDGNIEEQQIIGNPHAKVETAKGIRVAEWLVAHKIDVVLSHEDVSKKGPNYVLREAGIELRSTDR